jgi:hypothetical protein
MSGLGDSSRNSIIRILKEGLKTFGFLLSQDSSDTSVRLLLMLAKLQGKEVLKDDSLIRARLAARLVRQTGSLEFAISLISLAIEANDKRFFIDFGKCLAGREIKDSSLFDKRERDIAELVLFHSEMTAKQAVEELQRRNHPGITEENFRMWKMRLLKAKPLFDEVIARWRNKISTSGVTDD